MSQVLSVDRVSSASLEKIFADKWEELKRTPGQRPEYSSVTLAFHGTNPRNINSIKKQGLCVPGTVLKGGKSVTVKHGQAYGAGIYFSGTPGPSVRFS